MMIVFCEECGRKYRVDTAKIKGKAAKFTCTSCNHLIVVKKPDAESISPSASFLAETEPISEEESAYPVDSETEAEAETTRKGSLPPDPSKGIGLRSKIMIVLIGIPIIILFATGILCLSKPVDISTVLATYRARVSAQNLHSIVLNDLESDLIHIVARTNRFVAGVWIGGCVVILAIAVIYFLRLAGRIERLSDAAERISLGELDTAIDMTHRDEIGKIAEAIVRLQDSMRLALNRLRR